MLWWILGVVAALVAVALVVVLVGSRLPREHVATVRTKYAAPPESLWALLADPVAAKSWRSDVKGVDMLPPVDGKVAWEEEGGFGRIRYVVAESDKPRRFVSRITSEGLPYGGQWEHELRPVGQGTELSTTERGFVNPAFFRFMSKYFFGYTATIVGVHQALGAKLGEVVAPDVVASGR